MVTAVGDRVTRVELFEKIRRDERDEGLSIRELARRYEVHRRTVRQALGSPVPPARKTPVRDSPKLGPHIATIRGWLEADLDAPPKQRHTARRVWQRLVDERDADVSESTVRALVAEVKRELGLSGPEAMVPQSKPAGWEAEVDFGELWATLEGRLEKVWMFVMRMSFSGRTFRRIYGNEAGESFLDGHVRAFEFFGGVPVRIRYDNLTPAVVKVLLGKQRDCNPRFVALRSHYLFDSSFCTPGKGHEKGGVEGEIGRFRRNWLTPVPDVASLDELNGHVDAAVEPDDARRELTRDGVTQTVVGWWDHEHQLLAPLPVDGPADVVNELSCRVDTRARVCVRQAFYSVPARLAGRRVRVLLGASQLTIFDGSRQVATHPRSLHKGTETLTLDHYLDVLGRKPGALAGATALGQARTAGTFTDTHQAWWDQASRRLGDSPATRGLIDVLLEHRRLPAGSILAALADAVEADIVDPAVVIVEARRHADRHARPDAPAPVDARLAAFDRPAPDLTAYDQLLKDSA